MKINKMTAFLINAIIYIICVNVVFLGKVALGYIPFRFHPFWCLIAPIICAAASVLLPVRKPSLK